MELRNVLVVMGFILLISCPNVIAKETEELSLKERIVKLETKVDEGFKRVEEGFKSVNQRIDDVNQKMDNVRDELKSDIVDLRSLIYVVLAGIVALISFVIWDRRTTLAPVAHELKEIVKQEDLIIDVLKRYAQFEPKMAQAIKAVGLL